MMDVAVAWSRAYASAIAQAILWTALIVVAWSLVASGVFLWLTDAFEQVQPWRRLYAWWTYAPELTRLSLLNSLFLLASGIVATAPLLALARWKFTAAGGWRGIRQGSRVGRIVRGTSLNHSDADWMSDAEQAALFPSEPDPVIGGVVVGERDRVDLGPVARVPYDPDDRTTWGNGGKAPLLIARVKHGSPHSMTIGGSGIGKSAALVTTLLTWRCSMFCLDPSEELADLVGGELEARGKKVVRLTIGGAGPNVLAGININDPRAETRLRSVVGRIVGPMPQDEKGAIFARWGRTILTAFAADMLWNPDVAPEDKTLAGLRSAVDIGDARVRDTLAGIADHSHSPLARSLAGTMYEMVPETWTGAIGNATECTEWLASSNYGDLVSGSAYDMRELADGNLCVFCQIPQEMLTITPAVARVLTGCHLDAVFAAKGRMKGRVLFPIDEAALIGNDPALETARNLGRKSRVVLAMYYLSEGQIDKVWTPAGRKEWFDSLAWRTYAGVANLDTAKELSATLGTYGALATSEGTNSGRTGKPMEIGSRSSGTAFNEHEISRELAKPHELLTQMRDDERITIPRSRRPIRHGAALGFRRPEIVKCLGTSTYQSNPQEN